MAGKLNGQVAVVTGSGRGIGRSYAVALAAEGASVVIADNGGELGNRGSSKEPADGVVKEIKAMGGKAVASYEDVSDWKAAKRIVDTAVQSFGRLDIMITNAGADRRANVLDLTEEDWKATLGVHVFGSISCATEAGKVMRQQGGGCIVTVTSAAFYGGTMWLAPYVVSKGGTYALMRALSMELAPFNISVNAISPGFIRSRATIHYAGLFKELGGKDDAHVQRMETTMQTPESMGPIAVFLASTEGRKITGCVFGLNGSQVNVLALPAASQTAHTNAKMWDADGLINVLPRMVPATNRMPEKK